MALRSYVFLFVIGFVISISVAVFQFSPGYMDADYYFAGGLRLLQGYGFSEQILWNYLDDPLGLPHPSHAYWMPLVSILSAFSMILTGMHTFNGARIIFILLYAFVPLLTAHFSFLLTQRRDLAMMSGWLAILPAFYLVFLPTTDVFSLYMILGVLSLMLYHYLAPVKGVTNPYIYLISLALGLLAGLFHLTRTDGFLWLITSIIFICWIVPSTQFLSLKKVVGSIILCIAGYSMIMGPWMLRNLVSFGVLLSPGGPRALWILDYNELFIYPASMLTISRWWDSGIRNILNARLWALGQNLQTVLAVQGEIFLAPLVVLGLWHSRTKHVVRAGFLVWSLTIIIMTFIFPFQGARGGFFHSGAALQPLFWIMAPIGLEVFIKWGNRERGWNISQASRFFQVGMIVMAFLLTLIITYPRFRGGRSQANWNASYIRYLAIEKELVDLGAMSEDRVLVNNSPGYFIATGRSSLSIPYGNLQTVLNVAHRYQARYLILEIDQLLGDDDLFNNPWGQPGLRYLGSINQIRIFEVLPPAELININYKVRNN